MDVWWNPFIEQQAFDRVYRLGQTRDVTVHRLVAAGTVEEQILELHKKKETINRGALGGGNDKRTEARKVERTDRPRGGEGMSLDDVKALFGI